MKLLALDISTRTGWAFFEDAQLKSFGVIENAIPWDAYDYPKSFVYVVCILAEQIVRRVHELQPDVIVVEEVNKTGRFGSRHSQKLLDSIHHEVNRLLCTKEFSRIKVLYINSSDWRKKLNLSVAEAKKAAKPHLKRLAELEKQLANEKDRKRKAEIKQLIKDHKKELKIRCISGKIDKKSISVAYVNATFNLALKKGDNDISDAICQGHALIKGAKTLTNNDIFNNSSSRSGDEKA